MATLALPVPSRRAPSPRREPAAPRLPDPPALTLDDVLSGLWDGLAAAGAVPCPVCPGTLAPRWSAGAGVVGGRCGGCGTTLE